MCLFLSFTCYLIILTLIFLRTFITLTTGFINLRVWSTGTLTYISLWFPTCAFYERQEICSPEFEILLCAWKQRKKLKLKCMVWPSTEISCYLANTNRYQNCVKTVNLPCTIYIVPRVSRNSAFRDTFDNPNNFLFTLLIASVHDFKTSVSFRYWQFHHSVQNLL